MQDVKIEVGDVLVRQYPGTVCTVAGVDGNFVYLEGFNPLVPFWDIVRHLNDGEVTHIPASQKLKVGDEVILNGRSWRVRHIGHMVSLSRSSTTDIVSGYTSDYLTVWQNRVNGMSVANSLPAAKSQAESRAKHAADMASQGSTLSVPADVLAGMLPPPSRTYDTTSPSCQHQPRTVHLFSSTVIECSLCGDVLSKS